ncbi:FUSC family protein [Paraburkholderia phytofirmans]|uniref:FUSC family protein n=1 Tax=Paraburkholderia phytofirmans TaxID=261302 RepID=UPI000AEB408D|nr:FUSC family protein [Paraburkholderia phytofirmans]
MTERETDLLHRVLRFLLTVGLPVAAAVEVGVRPWLVYAVLSAIQAFVGDEGGTSLRRLGYMAIGPMALVAGAAVGTATVSLPLLFLAIIFVLGLFYGLVEGGHAHLLLLARFIGYGLVMGYAVVPLDFADCAAAAAAVAEAWTISLLWDLAQGRLRPLGVEPVWNAMNIELMGWRTRWTFALCAGLSIVAATLACAWLGLGHPYWATLTILVVLRSEMTSSSDRIIERVLGTLIGIAAVALLVSVAPGQAPLLAGMIVAAALRWPAFRVHVALGTATITAFVLLLGELLVGTPQAATHLLQDRLLATMVGCCFAMAGIGLHRQLGRRPRTAPAAVER